MGYGLIPLVASIILMIHHVAISGASRRSKVSVAILVVGSLVMWHYYPRWLVLATLLQSGVCIYVLVFQRLHGDGAD